MKANEQQHGTNYELLDNAGARAVLNIKRPKLIIFTVLFFVMLFVFYMPSGITSDCPSATSIANGLSSSSINTTAALSVNVNYPDLPSIHDGPLEKVISCHYTDDDGEVVSADSLDPQPRSIFFVETSCRKDLDVRQICAVESAARANPEWSVHVLFASPVSKTSLAAGRLAKLVILNNVRIARMHLLNYTRNTPVHDLIANGALNRSGWPVTHTSDVLRLVTLYKHAGVYLDLDVLVARPFDSLPKNWGARESGRAVSTGMIALSDDDTGRTISRKFVNAVASEFRGDSWSNNGPLLVTKVLQGFCNVTEPDRMSAATCGGFEVFGPEKFYPVSWTQYYLYFQAGELETRDAFAYHVWNKVSETKPVDKNSPYAKLARKFCPNTYNDFKEHFGS